MALRNTHTRLTGHPMEIAVSEEMLGRTFNGIGQPIDGLGDIISDIRMDINGQPLNPGIPVSIQETTSVPEFLPLTD